MTVLYVDRNEAGRIVNAWEDPQRDGHESVPLDDSELQAFLAMPVASFDQAKADQSRWG